MVRTHEILHLGGQVVLRRQLQTLSHVTRNHSRALPIVQLVVWIERTVLVLGEIQRIFYLSDIVIQCADLGQQHVAANLAHQILRQVGYLHRMLERSRSPSA